MNCLVLTEVYPPHAGGSGRWLYEIYRRLPPERTFLVVGSHPAGAEFDRSHSQEILRMDLSPPSWGLLNPGSARHHVAKVRELTALIRSRGIDQLHCGKCLPEGMIAWSLSRISGIPYVCYAHGEELSLARRTSRELRFLTGLVLDGAVAVVANSRNTQRELVDHWDLPESRVSIIHPGVDLELFRPVARDRAIRDQFGWGDRPTILTVGRLQERKGQGRLIRALGRVRDQIPEVLYAVVGDGPERSVLEDLVRRESVEQHVIFHGAVEDAALPSYFQQCDLFALPNVHVGHDFEGFGVVLLEAQACGRPVMVGRSGGTQEAMREPVTGRSVACEDPEALAETLIDMLSDRASLDRMGREARDWVEARFGWDRCLSEVTGLFHSLASEGSSMLPATSLTHPGLLDGAPR